VIVRVLFAVMLGVVCVGAAVGQETVTTQNFDALAPISEPYQIDEQTELILVAYEIAGRHRVMIHARNLETGWVSLVTDLAVWDYNRDPAIPVIMGRISVIDVNRDGRSEIILSRNMHQHSWDDRLWGRVDDRSDWDEILALTGWSHGDRSSNDGFVEGDEEFEIWGRDLASGEIQCWRWVSGVQLHEHVVSAGPCQSEADRSLLGESRINLLIGLPAEFEH
jgi:hypothetical protein